MNTITPRNKRLAELAAMVVNGEHTYKLDHITTIHIDGRHYFTVFRRYNSPYNIVVEDYNEDIYLFQNDIARQTLGAILCLSDYEENALATQAAFSFKHNGPAPEGGELLDMRWIELQQRFEAVNINLCPFGAYSDYRADTKDEDTPSTPRDQMIQTPTDPPGAPERPPSAETLDAAYTLLSLSIPRVDDPWGEREDNHPKLSMRFEDIQSRKRKREPVCYCEMHVDDYDESDDETVDTNNYTILRNGTMIPKAGIQ
jgi:hypothetical protein